jgi:hypothetical protein
LSRIVNTSVALISFFGFALAALLWLYAVMAWIGNRSYTGVYPRFGAPMLLTSLAVGCFLTTIRLIQGRKWAWWGAIAATVLTAGFGLFCMWAAFYSKDTYIRSEAIFVLLCGFMFVIPAAVTAVLLNLPQVRRTFLAPPTTSH